MKRYETVKFYIEREDFYQDYETDIELDVSVESNYGADFDGHRGIRRTFIDAWEILEVRNSTGVRVTITSLLRIMIEKEVNDLVLD